MPGDRPSAQGGSPPGAVGGSQAHAVLVTRAEQNRHSGAQFAKRSSPEHNRHHWLCPVEETKKIARVFPVPPRGNGPSEGKIHRIHAVSTTRAVDEKFCERFPRPPTGQRSIKRDELPRVHAVSATRATVPFAVFAASATLQSSLRPPRAPKALTHRNRASFHACQGSFLTCPGPRH